VEPALAEPGERLPEPLEEDKTGTRQIVKEERQGGLDISIELKEGEPTAEILRTVKEDKIDLLVMLAHEEGHLEHFLFGRSNHELILKMPCSILLVKKEPQVAPGPWGDQ
jgi:nucleotide-binding universal stress UspA family protein